MYDKQKYGKQMYDSQRNGKQRNIKWRFDCILKDQLTLSYGPHQLSSNCRWCIACRTQGKTQVYTSLAYPSPGSILTLNRLNVMSNYKNCTEISIATKCAMTQSYFIRKPFVYNRDHIIIRLTLFYEPSIPLFDASYCTCRFWIASKFNFENDYSLLFYAETGKLLRDELFKWAKYTSLRWTINIVGQQRQLVPVKAAAWFV